MKFLLVFLLFPLPLLAQKKESVLPRLSGVWTGYMHNDTTRLNNDFELLLFENKGKLSGYSYTVFLIDGKKNVGVKTVKIRERKGVLLLEDDQLINNNYNSPPAKGVRTFIELHYSKTDTSEILSGAWKTNITRQYNSVTGNIFLERNTQVEQTAIVQKIRALNLSSRVSFLAEPNIPKSSGNIVKTDSGTPEKIIPDTTITNPEITIFMFPKNDLPLKDTIGSEENKKLDVLSKDSFELRRDKNYILAERKEEENIQSAPLLSLKKSGDEMLSGRIIETIRTVQVNRDTLIFSLFDNGVIDGDTVSVLLNGEVIMSKIGLLARAYNDTIYLAPEMGDSITIILYAENLGSIPPNTGLLVIRDGNTNHEIRFSGDLKKNAAIILKRKKNLNGQ